jgi:hypothetical protein
LTKRIAAIEDLAKGLQLLASHSHDHLLMASTRMPASPLLKAALGSRQNGQVMGPVSALKLRQGTLAP